MGKAVQIMVIISLIVLAGALVYFIIESRESKEYDDKRIPYSHVSTGVLAEMTPPSLLYNQDIEFWSKNKLVKKQFDIETKFGQKEEAGNLFNYIVSSSEDCEREFDRANYPVQNYYQKAGIGTEKYNVHPARTCWIERVSPIKSECKEPSEGKPCLYSSKVNCVCIYAVEA